jgi:quercetin dioxygenase-like cupin family protein
LQLAFEKAFLVAMRIISSAVIALFGSIVWTTSVSAQDPAVALASTVKVKFENEKVRVLEAELPPGVKEKVHSHPAYVIYVLAGGKVRNYAEDGKITEAELKTGDVLYREPLTHAAENIGTTTMHLILVEMKTSASR